MAIDAVVSHTVFFHVGKVVPKLEVCWQINPNTLHYNTSEERKLVARVSADIYLTNASGMAKEDHYILQTVPRADLTEIVQHSIIDLRKYYVEEGMTKLTFRLTDLSDTMNKFSYTDSFMVHTTRGSIFFSGIELLDTIYESTVETVFSKNGKQLVPSCTNFLGDGMNQLRYYSELYYADHAQASDLPLVQKVCISKNESEGVYSNFINTDTVSKLYPFLPVSGTFNTASLPSGNYYLRMWLESGRHEVLASQIYFFQRLNKHPYVDTSKRSATSVSDTGLENVTVLNLKKTFVAKYSLGQIRAILKMLLPFSDKQSAQTINGFLKKPDELYMRYYIYNFFAAINKKDPGRAWKEFSNKITEVNKLFNTTSTPGYETERGVIYLRYGPPTEIITVENEQGTLPYQVWQYNTLTQQNQKAIPNAFFLFYKPSQMISDYKMLHSSVSGEVRNNQWRRTLYNLQGGGSDYSGNRVEQMIGNR